MLYSRGDQIVDLLILCSFRIAKKEDRIFKSSRMLKGITQISPRHLVTFQNITNIVSTFSALHPLKSYSCCFKETPVMICRQISFTTFNKLNAGIKRKASYSFHTRIVELQNNAFTVRIILRVLQQRIGKSMYKVHGSRAL